MKSPSVCPDTLSMDKQTGDKAFITLNLRLSNACNCDANLKGLLISKGISKEVTLDYEYNL